MHYYFNLNFYLTKDIKYVVSKILDINFCYKIQKKLLIFFEEKLKSKIKINKIYLYEKL